MLPDANWTALRTHTLRPAIRDAYILVLVFIVSMATLSITDTCTVIFRWVAANPDTEVDSLILAGMLSTTGMLIYLVRRHRELKSEVRLRASAERSAYKLAYRDTLTNLPNRRAFNQRLAEIVAISGSTAALLVVDLDGFKSINDAHGHGAGDCVLQQIAARLIALEERGCSVFRLGGDEFAILIHREDCVAVSQRMADASIELAAQPIVDGRLVHYIGASIGIAVYQDDTHDMETLFRCADIALYGAKAAGRGRAKRFEPAMSDHVLHRAWIERELRLALGTDAFQPHFQPIVSLATGHIVGYEMLARWFRPSRCEIMPDQFIPVAEETGLIGQLMAELLEKAFEHARHWPAGLWLSINVSPVQLNDPWIGQKILASLVRYGFSPHRLVIEITESALIMNPGTARDIVESFRNQGIKVALDDFGTGHSSLHHLRLLPFNKLKIDRSYVQAIATDASARGLVAGIISLAHHLGLDVIAEGVETQEVADQLIMLGCLEGQGWLFGRPQPVHRIDHLDRLTV